MCRWTFRKKVGTSFESLKKIVASKIFMSELWGNMKVEIVSQIRDMEHREQNYEISQLENENLSGFR